MRSAFSTACVHSASRATKGLVTVATQRIGGATQRAVVSGNSWPMRLGTSSPKMMVVKVMRVTTSAVAVIEAAPSCMPSDTSHCATGPLKAASPTMPLSMPIEVMPTCTVERNCVGLSSSLSAAAAPVSPLSCMAISRALRLAASAISDIAKAAFSTVSRTINSRSMRTGFPPGGKSRPWHST